VALIVLVPDAEGEAALSQLDGVRPVRYEADAPLPPEAAEAEVLIPPFLSVERVLELVGRLPRLRLVQLLTAGVEPWIGRLPEGIALSNARGAHGGSTAEWVLTVLLAVYRDLPAFLTAQAERRWDYHSTDTVQGKRVLVVGAGDLGQQVRRRLDAFDAHTTLVARRARPGVHAVDELPALLGEHDAVVLVVPLTEQTRGLVDADFLARMPDGAVLVNAARGPVVDTEALITELRRGRLRAALDVTDPEPLPADHPLWTAPNVLITPHVGGSCRGSRERSYAVAAAQIAKFAAGGQPDNLVLGEY